MCVSRFYGYGVAVAEVYRNTARSNVMLGRKPLFFSFSSSLFVQSVFRSTVHPYFLVVYPVLMYKISQELDWMN